MAEYMRNKRRELRRRAIEYLGGKCTRCGTTDDLEIDHVDRRTKKFTFGGRVLSWEKLVVELKKCQLLCATHHLEKTVSEIEVPHGGGLAGKRRCKCDLCRQKKNKYLKHY